MPRSKKIAMDFKAGQKLPNYLETDSPIYKFPECAGKVLPDPIYYYAADESAKKQDCLDGQGGCDSQINKMSNSSRRDSESSMLARQKLNDLTERVRAVTGERRESREKTLDSNNILVRKRRHWTGVEKFFEAKNLMVTLNKNFRKRISNGTYIVANDRGIIFRFSRAKSLCFFDKDSQIRQMAIRTLIHPWFTKLITLVIFINCACMASMPDERNPVFNALEKTEYVFYTIYMFEAMVKIISYGFVLHPLSYMRDYWNWIDFIVIVTATFSLGVRVAFAGEGSGYMPQEMDALRAFRVLRALKTMSVIPGLKSIVSALLRSINALKNAIFLTTFCVSVFALVGSQLFAGTLRQKSIRDPGKLELAPIYNTLLVDNNWDNTEWRERIKYNIDQKVTLINRQIVPLWFQVTRENGDVITKEEESPQRDSKFGQTYDMLRWKYFDHKIARYIIDHRPNITQVQNSTVQLNPHNMTMNVPEAWHESALVRMTERLEADSKSSVVLENCNCLKDDERCRHTLNGTECEYELTTDCQYKLVKSDKNQTNCSQVIDATKLDKHSEIMRHNQYCFNSSVPRCNAVVQVEYFDCNITEDSDENVRQLCSSRSMVEPGLVCEFTRSKITNFTIDLLEQIRCNQTMRQALNTTMMALDESAWRRSIATLWTNSSDHTLMELMKVNETDFERKQWMNNTLLKDVWHGGCENSSLIAKLENVTLLSFFQNDGSQLQNCSPKPIVGVDYYKRKDTWLTNTVAQFRFKLSTSGSNGTTRFASSSFIFYIAKNFTDFEDTEAKQWQTLGANQAQQEPSMGVNYHPGATDRLKKDQQYCMLRDDSTSPPGHVCREAGENPDYGYTSYDSFGVSFLSAFRLVSLDAWNRNFYLTIHTSGPWYAMFYVFVVLLGSYYLVNLILAVVYEAYEEQLVYVEQEQNKAKGNDPEIPQRLKRPLPSSIKEDNVDVNQFLSRMGSRGYARTAVKRSHRPSVRRTRGPSERGSMRQRGGSQRNRPSRCSNRVVAQSAENLRDNRESTEYLVTTSQQAEGSDAENTKAIAASTGNLHQRRRPSSRRVGSSRRRKNTPPRVNVFPPSPQLIREESTNHLKPPVRGFPPTQDEGLMFEKVDEEKEDSSSFTEICIIKPPRDLYASSTDLNLDGEQASSAQTSQENLVEPPPYKSLDVIVLEKDDPAEIAYSNYELKREPMHPSIRNLTRNHRLSNSFHSTHSVASESRKGTPIEGGSLRKHVSGFSHISQLHANSTASLPPNQEPDAPIRKSRSPSRRTHRMPDRLHRSHDILLKREEGVENSTSRERNESQNDRQPLHQRSSYFIRRHPFTSGSTHSSHIGRSRNHSGWSRVSTDTDRPARRSQTTMARVVEALCDEIKTNIECEGSMKYKGSKSQHGRKTRDHHGSEHSGRMRKRHHKHSKDRTLGESIRHFPCQVRSFKNKLDRTFSYARFTDTYWPAVTRYLGDWECCPTCYKILQKHLKKFITNPLFEFCITLSIVVNTIFMTLEKYPMDDDYKDTLDYANLSFTIIFSIEMFLKMVGLTPSEYLKTRWNQFDAVIVIVSLIEVMMSKFGASSGTSSSSNLAVLRAFRLMRILKLAKRWPTLNKLLVVIGQTLGRLWPLTFVFIVVLFIFAVIGMQFFSKKYQDYSGDRPSYFHFKDFAHSFLTIFRIQCGEWFENMVECNTITGSPGLCISLFILAYFVGNLVILNLFLALLLNAFSKDMLNENEKKKENEEETDLQKVKDWLSQKLEGTCAFGCRLLKIGVHETINHDAKNSSTKSINFPLEVEEKHQLLGPDSNNGTTQLTTEKEATSVGSSRTDSGFMTPSQTPPESRDQMETPFISISDSMTTDPSPTPVYRKDLPSFDEKEDVKTDDEDDENNNQSRESLHKSKTSLAEVKVEEEKEVELVDCLPIFKDKPGTQWYKIRVFFHKTIENPWFENLVVFFILLSSLMLALEDYYAKEMVLRTKIVNVVDKICVVFFTIEMVMKWLGMGWKSYFTNPWCLLDFGLVCNSIFCWVADGGGASYLRSLRTLRALRPLRALSRFEKIKIVVDALVRAIPSISQVVLVCLIFWLIFSILGVNLFGGKFGRCVAVRAKHIFPAADDNITSWLDVNQTCNNVNNTFFMQYLENPDRLMHFKPDLKVTDFMPKIYDKVTCLKCIENMQGYWKEDVLRNTSYQLHSLMRWEIPAINFDNVFVGFIALLEVATFNGWVEIMANAVDAKGVDLQPSFEVNWLHYIYFLGFIVFGSFFSLNLFIGVIIDNFNQQKLKTGEDGSEGVFLTDKQLAYRKAMQRMVAKTPTNTIPRPQNKFCNKIYNLVNDRRFEMTVMTLVVLNMVSMALEHHNMGEERTVALHYTNIIFLAFFIVEAILKLIGLRLHYFKVYWNIFDFSVVLISVVVTVIGSDALDKIAIQPTIFRVIRIFRVTRVLRLIREAKKIRTLLFALMMSLPALLNIGLLLFLIIFIYAIVGMFNFQNIEAAAGYDSILNFKTCWNSLLVLFQLSTSEGWDQFLGPAFTGSTVGPCDYGHGECEKEGPNSTLAAIFYVTYVMVTFLIVVNMYIAVILENFDVATRESTEPLTADDFEQFFEVWQKYDDRMTQYVDFNQLKRLLHSLDPPLRVPIPNIDFISESHMAITRDGKIHCLEVIVSLVKKVLGDSNELANLKENWHGRFEEKCKNTVQINEDTIDSADFCKIWNAALIIQRVWRNYCEADDENYSYDEEDCDEDDFYSESDYEEYEDEELMIGEADEDDYDRESDSYR